MRVSVLMTVCKGTLTVANVVVALPLFPAPAMGAAPPGSLHPNVPGGLIMCVPVRMAVCKGTLTLGKGVFALGGTCTSI